MDPTISKLSYMYVKAVEHHADSFEPPILQLYYLMHECGHVHAFNLEKLDGLYSQAGGPGLKDYSLSHMHSAKLAGNMIGR